MDLDARYEKLDKIGAGSFATVYRARDNELGREVAIKQIHEQYLQEHDALDRYWQEAQLLASLQHPNIVTIFDIHRDRGWLILELMQANLSQRLGGRQMPLSSVRTTLAHSLRALKYLHGRGIVHGDIKLSNLMLDARRRVKIGDFGLARRASDDEGSLLKGTTKYMAPELVSDEFGEIGPQSDLYSLGFCAYELMCGSNFESLFPGLSAFGRNKQVAWMMWHAAPDRRLPEVGRVLEDVPGDLAKVIETLTEKDQGKRYSSADKALADLKTDLKLSQGGNDDVAGDESDDDKPDDGGKKRLLIAGGAFAMSLLMCVVLLFSGGGDPPVPKSSVFYVLDVDAESNRLKVEDLNRTRAQEISLGKQPRIFLTNTNANILARELQPNDRIAVEVETDAQGRQVRMFQVTRPITSTAVIRKLDRAHRRITVAIEDNQHRELDLRVPESAKVFARQEGELVSANFRDIKQDDSVAVTYLDEYGDKPGRYVVSLTVTRYTQGRGFISEVNADEQQLTVTYGLNASNPMTMKIAEECAITLGEERIKLADLKKGDRVRFSYDNLFREIHVIRDEIFSSASIDSIDYDKREIIAVGDSGRKTFTVPKNCDITLAKQPANLGDLRRYDVADITFHAAEGEALAATSILITKRAIKETRWAVIIGVQDYMDKSLSPLTYSAANAELLRDTLINRYAFNPDRITTLIDLSKADLQSRMKSLLDQATSQTHVIVYFCGHAYRDENNRTVLAAKDFNWNARGDTGWPLADFIGQVEACKARDKTLLFEACHQGNGPDLKSQPSAEEMLREYRLPLQTTICIGNCSRGQRGHALNDGRHSLFGRYTADAYAGAADTDRDLVVTPKECFSFVAEKLKGGPLPEGTTQTPFQAAPR